jgi:hypothetical protein
MRMPRQKCNNKLRSIEFSMFLPCFDMDQRRSQEFLAPDMDILIRNRRGNGAYNIIPMHLRH